VGSSQAVTQVTYGGHPEQRNDLTSEPGEQKSTVAKSNSPAEGGRRARLAAERLAHQTDSRDSEVLDSRRARRPGRAPVEHPHDLPRSGRPIAAPQNRREQVQRSGRLNSLPEGKEFAAPLIDPTTGSFTAVDGRKVPVPGSVTVNRTDVPAGRTLFSPNPQSNAQSNPYSNPQSNPYSNPQSNPYSNPHSNPAGAPTPTPASQPHPSGPDTTELTIVRGRRAAAPQSSRRRFELAIGRSLTSRKAWAGGVVVALVALVPVVSMLHQKNTVTVREADLTGSGTNLKALQQEPDPTQVTVQPDAAEVSAYARERANAAAEAAAKKAARTAVIAKPKTRSTAVEPPRASGGQINNLSGLPWRSGVYMPGDKPSNAVAFGNWRGAAVDVVVTWPARQSWEDVINPHWMFNAWKGTPYTKVFGVAPIPEGVDASISGCASGSYNSKWTEFGQNIQAAGLADESIIRLGWEFNGEWYKWSANNPDQWAECWRQIVGTVKKEAPKLRFDWNVNRGPGTSVTDAAEAYPGDAYVDIVGIDSYDSYPGVTSEANWQKQYSGPYGLKHWADFAKAHGKKVSVPEWGVYPGTAHADNNGGDNAFYITKMRGFFAEQGSRLAYEAYFNEDDSYYGGSIFSPVQNPSASSKYKALFSN
jgi:glycosyl hydrolase family 26